MKPVKAMRFIIANLALKICAALYFLRLMTLAMLPRITSCQHLISGSGGHLGPNLTWDPELCTLKNYSPRDIKECSVKIEEQTGRPTTLAFSGDSSIMEVANATHVLLSDGFFEVRTSEHRMLLWYPFENLHVAFQGNVHMAHRELMPFLHLGQVPTLLVVDGGAWHFAGQDAHGRHMFLEASARHLAKVLERQFNSTRILWTSSHQFFKQSSPVRTTTDEIRIYHNTHYLPYAELFLNHYVTPHQKNILVWSSTTKSLVPAIEAAKVDGLFDFVHFMPEISIVRAQMVLNFLCNAAMALPKEYCCAHDHTLIMSISGPGPNEICLLIFVSASFFTIRFFQMVANQRMRNDEDNN